MRRHGWVLTTRIGLCLGLLLALATFLAPTHALAAPQTCNEAGLDAALLAGGMQTFNCAPGSTITISATKGVGRNVTLDGGGNLTIDGGGLYQVFYTGNNVVTFGVANLTITGGSNGVSDGGGIFNQTSTVNVTNSNISGNSAGNGGGIYNKFGTVNVTNSTISGNSVSGSLGFGSSYDGGGIYNEGGTVTVTNSTISGNSAACGAGMSSGGGIRNFSTLTVTNSTISGNSISCNNPGYVAGGGINNDNATATVTGSIVAGNTAGQYPDISNYNGTLTDGGGNLLRVANPKLAPLGNYGGTTQTMPPLSGSPAIDNGKTTCTVTDPISGAMLSTDQRGVTRPQGAKCDSGSVEYVATTITSANSATFTVGTAGTFTVTTTGYPTPTLGEAGNLPAGVTFTDNGNGTATLSGTPTSRTGGTYALTITATSGAESATQSFTLTVDEAPTFRTGSTTSATFTVGTMGSVYVVLNTSYPTATTISEMGALPMGVTFVDNGSGGAALSGTPAAGTSGTYTLTIKASNGVNPDATEIFTLTVNQAPAITSANSATFPVGAVGTFTVTTTGYPTPTLSKMGALPMGVTFVDNGNGTATLSGTPATGTGGTYSLTFSAGNGVGANATQMFMLTVNQAPAITSANSATFTVGTMGSFTVTTTGYPKPTLSEMGALPMGVTFVDNGNGTATLSGTPATGTGGTYSLTLTAGNSVGANATQMFTLTVNEAPRFTGASSATVTAGGMVNVTIAASGYPPPTLSATGTPTGVTFHDNGNGTASLTGTAPTTAGDVALMLTATNNTSTVMQTFTLHVVPGAASKLVFVQQPGDTVAGSAITPAVTVQVQDAYGNPVTGDNMDQVPLSLTGGTAGATLSGGGAVTVSGGLATFAMLRIDKAGTGYTLTANSGVLTGATSSSFTVTPGAPARLMFMQQPTNVAAGGTITPAVTVQVQDSSGNLVTGDSTDQVTLSLAGGTMGATLTGSGAVPVSGGIATFSMLSVNKAGTGYTLSATGGMLTGATSSSFTVTAGVATYFTMTAIPTMLALNAPATVTVTALDANNNVATGYSGTIHFTSSDTHATLPADYPFVVGDAGVKTFTNGVAFHTAGMQSVTATDTQSMSITGSATGISVAQGTASTSVTSGTMGTSAVGQSVTFTATVTGVMGTTPTGSVTFSATPIGSMTSTPIGGVVMLNGMGTATSAAITTIPAGSYTIAATYSGDANYTAGTPGTVSQTVGKLTSSVSVASNSAMNTSAQGVSVTLTATVTGTMGNPTPTGSVTFTSGSLMLGSAMLSNGTASVSTTALPVGMDTITASYSGDATYATSSGTTTQTVTNAAVTSLSVSAPTGNGSGNSGTATMPVITPGGSIALTVTGSYTNGMTGSVTGLTFTSGNPNVVSVTSGGMLTALSPGTATITVTGPNNTMTTITVTVGMVPTGGLSNPNVQPMTHPVVPMIGPSPMPMPSPQPQPAAHPTGSGGAQPQAAGMATATPVPQPARH